LFPLKLVSIGVEGCHPANFSDLAARTILIKLHAARQRNFAGWQPFDRVAA